MISIIVAVAQNGVIGGENRLLWHISEDLQRFKRITSGHPVVMGRKTFDSLGKPLPNRHNVVITRQRDYLSRGVTAGVPEGKTAVGLPESVNAAGSITELTIVGSLEEAISLFPRGQEIFITGGGEIYRQALPLAEKVYLTIVHHDYHGDTHFPQLDPAQWRETFREYHPNGKNFPYPFEYINYIRNIVNYYYISL